MLAEVLLKREPRSVTDISAPTLIEPSIMLAAVILRQPRVSLVPGVITPPPGGGATTFLELTDTPDDYAGEGGNFVAVKADESGLEYIPPPTPGASAIVRNFAFGLKRSAGIATGKLAGYWTCPFAGTITAWNLTVDAGTITVKIWKKATGTAHPTSADSINTSGLALSSNTSIHSTTLTDFTTLAVSAGDIFACEVTAVGGGVADFGGSIEITQA